MIKPEKMTVLFSDPEFAKVFISWYSNQGEQAFSDYLSFSDSQFDLANCDDTLTTPTSMTLNIYRKADTE